jgi:hypothetical protein
MKVVAALWVLLLVAAVPVAHADIGGNPIGPGPCDYPATGITAFFNPLLGRGELAYCRFPQEINGSYYVQALGDYTIAGGITGSRGGSAILGVGGGGARTGFFCLAEPDNAAAFIDPAKTQKAADPRPPGAWKSKIEPSQCKPEGVPETPPPAPAYEPPAAAGILSPALPQPDQLGPPR